MFAALNILVFLLLTLYAFKTLISAPSYVALSKTEKVLLTGREKFLLITIITGMIEVGGVSIGLNLSAWRMLIWMMMIILAFLLYRKSPWFNVMSFSYLFFIGWMFLSLSWTESIPFGIRVILKYLYPFLILLFAMTFVRSKDFIFVVMKWLIVTAFILSLFLGAITVKTIGGFFYLHGVFWHWAAFADYMAIMSGLAYLMWWRTKDKRYFYLILWFLASVVVGSNRTGILGILSVFTVASYLRYKVLALPYIAGVVSFALISVLFVPQVREKMFYDPNAIQTIGDLGSIGQDQIDSNGRFAMWEWTLNNYYEGREWVGSGIGTVQKVFYNLEHPFGSIKIIHNDYIQMLADIGLVGIGLYVIFVLLSINTARHYVRPRFPEYLQNTSFLVITSFAAALTTMMTDNVVNYAFSVHSYPFIFVGIMLAYRKYRYELKIQKRNR